MYKVFYEWCYWISFGVWNGLVTGKVFAKFNGIINTGMYMYIETYIVSLAGFNHSAATG